MASLLLKINILNMKKGISSILGAIIIIQIVVLSVGLILYLTSLNAKMSNIAYSQIHEELQNTPISVIPTYQGPMIISSSTSHLAITYILYPNGEVIHTNIPITQNGVYINLDNYPWSIIVLNDGNWYNISANDRLVYPNISGLGKVGIYAPYTIYPGKSNLYYLVTPPIYGKNLDPTNWNLLSATPASYTPYGIQNSIIFIPENGTIPIIANLTSRYQYFDIAIPYYTQVFVAVSQGATPGIYYTANSPQFSYYLPLEFGISYQVNYLVPVYNVTFIYSQGKIFVAPPGSYYVTLSYVTYDMIYFMKEHNYTIQQSNGAQLQLISYKFTGYLLASSINYGYVCFGGINPYSGSPVWLGIPIPGYNNYTLYNGVEIDASYNIDNVSGDIYPVVQPAVSTWMSQSSIDEFLNISNITKESVLSISMMISGGNLDYNINGTPINNVMNYTYFWYFLNPQINPNNVNLIVSITPNSQITIALKENSGGITYPNFAYITYNLAKEYSYSINYNIGPIPPVTIVRNNITGILIDGGSEGYLPLGYPVVNAHYRYENISGEIYLYSETATYQYFKYINSQIDYNLPFIIMIPENVYYPYFV
nr:archaellin/type IV pilin N-terminal domain-containing protein [Sulfolobus sp. E5-1-F]